VNLQRIGALVLRSLFIYRRSPARIVEVFYWPAMTLLVWGYVTEYIQRTTQGQLPHVITFLIGAVILWDILYRVQQGMTISFLEDVWARNLLNVFCAPVRLREYVAAAFLFGLFRVVVSLLFLTVLALALYRFNILDLGLLLIPFIANLLMFGLALGVVTTAMIVRYGHAAEGLAWGAPLVVQPFSAVFYPVTVLPVGMQMVARVIPTTHVFEGMRHVIATGTADWRSLGWAIALNVLYLMLALAILTWTFAFARDRGLLGKLGAQ
jgi:ABC-2 type transport system permease protein